MKKRRFIISWIIVVLVVIVSIYAWPRLPILTGFAAKGMCSGVFVAGRDAGSVKNTDLSFFPISLATVKVNRDHRSATATLFGLAKRTAIYRDGLGCTLVSDPEAESSSLQNDYPLPPKPFDPDTILWPLGNIIDGTTPGKVNKVLIDSILQASVDQPGEEPLLKTFATVIVYNDTLIGEAYAESIDKNTPLLGWSMTKSITNALTGILVGEGRIDVTKQVPVESWSQDERRNITWTHLMHMTSGLKWDENYFDVSEATKMLFMSDDMFSFCLSVPAAYPPDSVWYYSSGSSNIVSGLLRQTLADDRLYHQLPYEALFYRCGMLNTTIEADVSGTFVGSSFCYGTARDWARFGLLYLHNGIFEGDTILPPGWVDFTREPAPHSGKKYGAFFWLNGDGTYPDAPRDLYYCDGFLGQRVFIIPSKKLVIVRLGWSYEHFDFNRFLADIIRAVAG